ncbi:MAG: GNAT family N-acetyltransferase [Planctomycetota bacterium]|jgi:GNAT superfamily N-acetyltransferase
MQKHNNDLAAYKTVKIIEAGFTHVSGMARCHIKSFPGRFMTVMGYHWLCALYRFFIKHRGGICRIAVDTNCRVIGLAAGGDPHIREEFLSSALFRHPHLIFWKFLSKRMVRRVLLKELAGKLHLKHAAALSRNTKAPSAGIRSGNLLSICVLPDCEGTGVGGKLIDSFQLACKAKGYERLTLSVLKKNSRAVAFYEKHGWHQNSLSGESTKFYLDL